MAHRRCLHSLSRHGSSFLSPKLSLHSLKTLTHLQTLTLSDPQNPNPKPYHILHNISSIYHIKSSDTRHFSSQRRGETDGEEEYDEGGGGGGGGGGEEEEEEEEEESSDGEEEGGGDDIVSVSNCERAYSVEEKEKEAAAIGYNVIGPLEPSDRPFKPYEPVFAVVQIGSHQFKVSNGDCIFTERLKFCEVNDKLILNRVLLLGSSSQTIIGRPTLPDAAVHAVVEEHALDAKVIIFKKKRRKNYRRTKGHRQELTKLRITDIQGIEKPEKTATGKPEKAAVKKPEKASVKKLEKVAVAA